MAIESNTTGAPDDIALVRQTLMRELETINAYEQFASSASRDEVRRFLAHLGSEEKEHVAEATALLRRLDAEQQAIFEAAKGPEHYLSTRRPEKVPTSPVAQPRAPGFTVGSLRAGRR